MTRRLWPSDLMCEAGMKQVFRRALPFFYPLVNVHITVENHHFLMGKLTIFNSYVKLPEGNQQPSVSSSNPILSHVVPEMLPAPTWACSIDCIIFVVATNFDPWKTS